MKNAVCSLRPDLFRPSPKRVTFQTLPSVAEERGWPAEGTTVPAAIKKMRCAALGRTYSGRPPKHVTFQTLPSVAEERGWPAEGTTVPAAIKKMRCAALG